MRKKPFPYAGSKLIRAELIIKKHFPTNFRDMAWLDSHGGSGIMTYLKPPSSLEIFNDLDEGISAIFHCLLYKYEEFAWRLTNYAQHSESILRWVNSPQHQQEHTDIVDKAITKLYSLCYSFGALGNSIAYWKNPHHAKGRKETHLKIFDREVWENWRNRFELVQILNRDAIDVIKDVDTKDMFVYCDPPYVLCESRSGPPEKRGLYQLNYNEEDHKELAKVLHNIEGKCLVSYDNHPLVRELYEDFYSQTVSFSYSLPSSAGKNRVKKDELLLANYPLRKHTTLTKWVLEEPSKIST